MINLPSRLLSCARPIVVETGIEGFAHAAWGSTFLVGYKGRTFVVTTRHGLLPGGELFPLCVRSPTGKLFTPVDVYFVPPEAALEDYTDIAVVELDISSLSGDLGDTPIIPLDIGESDWDSFKYCSPFRVLGFPRDHTFVDFENGEVVEGLVVLDAQYTGPSESHSIHLLKVLDPPPLTTFSGFSGGPVFLIRLQIGCPAVPILAGMALQGSIESGVVRFVDRDRIVDMIDAKLKRPRMSVAHEC